MAHQHKLVVGSGTGEVEEARLREGSWTGYPPADLFTKGVGREKLQQFAWASGQIFLDGRADKSLQAQGVGLSQVGIGRNGILRVSSGSDNSVNPAGNRWAPNAPLTNTTQKKSKMSELAHAEIGKIDTAVNAVGQRASRTIGAMQTSCIAPKRQQNPQRNCRGGVVGPCGSLANGLDEVISCVDASRVSVSIR